MMIGVGISRYIPAHLIFIRFLSYSIVMPRAHTEVPLMKVKDHMAFMVISFISMNTLYKVYSYQAKVRVEKKKIKELKTNIKENFAFHIHF